MYRLAYVFGAVALAASFSFAIPVLLVCLFLWGMIALVGLFL